MSVSASATATGNDRVDGLLGGTRWVGAVSYSDPDSPVDYGGSYWSDYDSDGWSAQRQGFSRFSASQLAAVRAALDSDGAGARAAHAGFAIEGFTNLKVTYAGSGSGAGLIRYANSSDAPSAYTYLPGEAAQAGDAWFGNAGRKPVAGNYDYMTILHETGHALGLKHPHENTGLGILPESSDTPEFTVMTYRAYQGATPTGYEFETWGAPQTYMMRDIAALQALYGANYAVNSGTTVYAWRPDSGTTYVNGAAAITPGANRIFATVWDGGGRDTYDLSAYSTDLKIDLRPGKYSVFSTTQLADLGGGPNDAFARGNIFNALTYRGSDRSLVENAIGGGGKDAIRGNDAANQLEGGAGNDTLTGGHGADTLVGGSGRDTFRFYSGDSTPNHTDRLAGGGGAAAFQSPGAGSGDRIDLHHIDADTLRSGEQSFHFGGGESRGHIWLEDVGSVTYVYGNTDRDTAPEFELAIADGARIHAADYTATDFLL